MTRRRLASTPAAWMIGGSLATCLLAVAATGSRMTAEIVLGMAGPLSSAVVSWQLLERTHASAPGRLTSVMVAAFGVKALLFGVYVIVILAVLSLDPTPFVVSFTSYYVALHVAEAMLLKRMLAADGLPPSAWPEERRVS